MKPEVEIGVSYNGNSFTFSSNGWYCISEGNVGKVDIVKGTQRFLDSSRAYLTFGTLYDNPRVVELCLEYEGLPYVDDLVAELEEVPLDDLNDEDGQLIIANGSGLPTSAVEIVLHHLISHFGHPNFIDLNKVSAGNASKQMKVVNDFFVGKLNLKEREFEVVKQLKDWDGNAYIVGNFGEDINGASLDGAFPTRSCAIIPMRDVKPAEKGGEEDKKKKKVSAKGKVIGRKAL